MVRGLLIQIKSGMKTDTAQSWTRYTIHRYQIVQYHDTYLISCNRESEYETIK